jgi:hypothetical protein
MMNLGIHSLVVFEDFYRIQGLAANASSSSSSSSSSSFPGSSTENPVT